MTVPEFDPFNLKGVIPLPKFTPKKAKTPPPVVLHKDESGGEPTAGQNKNVQVFKDVDNNGEEEEDDADKTIEEVIEILPEPVPDLEGKELNTPNRKVRETSYEYWNLITTAAKNKRWEPEEI